MGKWFDKHQAMLMLLGGVVATLVTLTAYAFTTFQTKEDTKGLYQMIETRFNRLEDKVDALRL